MTNLLLSGNAKQTVGLTADHQTGQQLHVSGVFIVLLELALILENLLPVYVVLLWLPNRAVSDRLVAAFSIVCILSAIVPAPLGLASYFSGGWYGGAPTCTTYQVTSLWCNMSSLALLTYICAHCNVAVRHLCKLTSAEKRHTQLLISSSSTSPGLDVTNLKKSTSCPRPEVNNLLIACQSKIDVKNHLPSDVKDDSIAIRKTDSEPTFSTDVPPKQSERFDDAPVGEDNPKLSIEVRKLGAIYTNSNSTWLGTSHSISSPSKKPQIHGSIHFSSRSNRDASLSTSGFGYSRLDARQEYHPRDSSTEINGSWFKTCRSSDYVTLSLFFVFFLTMSIASLPVVGLGPPTDISETSCRSWLVPLPEPIQEKVFCIAFIVFISVCLMTGSWTGVCVCIQVSQRIKLERRRKCRLYHEENVPDLEELSIMDTMKRHYSLTCIVLAGQLTWVPLLLMMVLHKSGVEVSEATLMYSNIVTSLPGLLNPLLYSLALANYRAGYKAFLNKCQCRKQRKGKTNDSVDDQSVDVTINVSQHGHLCIRGRANPSGSHTATSSFDCEEDEDDYPDSVAEPEPGRDVILMPSEKTPLNASADSVPPLLINSPRLARCHPQGLDQSIEYLLPCVDNDDETGL
ncbi:hypothetical protein Bpfe_000461 [Biomphalaria pfeifferi]|uniref:G-protein coupled receptors family 1 profile domain-containing protein n=1 Tax=Biomphalaria pfeifferi TaxID=112525 RepID=A0AAD8CDX0_BIOPF|nr:hypothetical protein Bpfe_000461 [Biomphalaria pfeifferi]